MLALRAAARALGVTGAGGRGLSGLAGAASIYREHPRSHYQFALDDITIEVGSHYARPDEPTPTLRYAPDVDNTIPGILHVTPFSVSQYCFFGEKGNLGRKSKFTKSFDNIISDPAEASHEITLVPHGLGDADTNVELLDYLQWLGDIRSKLVDHLTENLDAYPSLAKKYGFLAGKGDDETLREMIDQLCTNPVRYAKDEAGDVDTEQPTLPFRQKLFFRASGAALARAQSVAASMGEIDAEMLGRNYARKHVPLYNRDGHEVPLANAALFGGDIVSIENRLLCQLYDVGGNVGAGLKRNMASVVQIDQRRQGDAPPPPQSPFQDIEL